MGDSDNNKENRGDSVTALTTIPKNASRFLTTIYQSIDHDEKLPSFSEREQKIIDKHMSYMATGSTSVLPVTCPGEAGCFYRNKCPLVKIDRERKAMSERELTLFDDNLPEPFVSVLPVGKSCTVETSLLNEWTAQYILEYEVTDQSFTELQMCRELAEIELMLWRVNFKLSQMENSFMVGEEVVGATKDGELFHKEAPLAVYNVKERLQKRKSNLIKLMVGDRQEKYKKQSALKIKDTDDTSTRTAELRGVLNQLITEATKKMNINIEEKQLEEKNVIDSVFEIMEEEQKSSSESLDNSNNEEK